MKNEKDDADNLENYRSMVGRIMYLTSKISPEYANASRELARHMHNLNKDHWEEMEKMIGYLKGKENHQIRYRTPTEMKSISFVDANYAKNLEDKSSFTGMVNTTGNMITNWASKTQEMVYLSSKEAEYISIPMCAQELIFFNCIYSTNWEKQIVNLLRYWKIILEQYF